MAEGINKNNRILKAMGLFGGVQLLNIFLNIVRTKCVALLLGFDGIGLNAIYNETRELIHTTTNLGLDVSGVRGISAAYEQWLEADSEELRSEKRAEITCEVAVLRSWVLLLALIGTLLCMVCAMPLSRFTFGDTEHVWGYVILAPAVGFSTIACGELAVLKALRRLKVLASVSVLNVMSGIVVCLPMYYLWGIDGVLPALLALAFVIMIINMFFSYRAEKPKLVYTNAELRRGYKMLSVGFNFVTCGIMEHVVLLGIQSYLNNRASLEMVGLYNSCYTMTMTYAGLVFAAMDTDYFPRLSGLMDNVVERENTLLRQLNVTVMLITPLLVAMIVALPVLVPLLLSSDFMVIVPMAQATTVGLLFRAIYLPNSLMSLAGGDNKTFLFINIIGSVDILLVLVGYEWNGLLGMGIALSVQNLIDMLLVLAISKWKYRVRFTRKSMMLIVESIMILAIVYAICTMNDGWTYWIAGILLTIGSALLSLYNYRTS